MDTQTAVNHTVSGTRTRRAWHGWLVQSAVSILVALALLGTAVFYLRVFKPKRYVSLRAPSGAYESLSMRDAMSQERVRAHLDSMCRMGSRLLGQPGAADAGAYLRDAYAAAGLEVYEHTIRTVTPRTAFREIYLDSAGGRGGLGRRLDDVGVYPFMANYIQPPVTPDTGLSGELVVLDAEALRTRERFDDCIGLLDSDGGSVERSYGYAWTRYARLGVKALIVSNRAGLDSTQWQVVAGRFSGMVVDAPVNYVRVAASSEIFKYAGRRVRLRVRVDFVNAPGTSYIGVLRAATPAREAVVLQTRYDVSSILPDLAINPLQTIEPAVHLQLLSGLQHYRSTIQRDVIFVAFGAEMMGRNGQNNIIRLLDENGKSDEANALLAAMGIKAREKKAGRRMKPVVAARTGNADTIAIVERLGAMLADSAVLDDPAPTSAALASLDSRSRAFFDDQFRYVVNTVVLERNEPKLQARIAFERKGSTAVDSPEFTAYLLARRAYEEASSAAGLGPVTMLTKKLSFARSSGLRERFASRIRELEQFHREEGVRLDQEIALVRLLDSYEGLVAFETRVLPPLKRSESDEIMTMDPGGRLHEPAVPTIANLLTVAGQRLDIGRGLRIVPPGSEQRRLVGVTTDLWTLESDPLGLWHRYGYPAYRIATLGRVESMRRLAFPVDLPSMHNLSGIQRCLWVAGEACVSLAHGNGLIQPVNNEEFRNKDYGGQVLVSNVGQSIVPSYPLKNAVVAGHSFPEKAMYSRPGFYDLPFIMTNPYGRYSQRRSANEFGSWWHIGVDGWGPVAAGYGADGTIAFMKDEGEDGQRLFKSTGLPISAASNVTIVTFRASPVALVDLTNPQTMKDYSSLELMSVEGLTGFGKRCAFWDKGLQMVYLEPDARFYAALQSGSPTNELVKMVRGFMLNIHDPKTFTSDKEIAGEGYLAADNPFLRAVPLEVGRSMAWVNAHRLSLQNRYGMADEQTNEYQVKTMAALDDAVKPGITHHAADQSARDAVMYATLNHPVLRESVFQAVLGILWYLALLVPFVFFFEKLLFCNTDVRRQIAAQVVIFLVVFAALRLLHPAFHMVRSSLMILLGFLIILISGGITLLFSSKFQENLDELRKKQGKVSAAEANRFGVIMSAFMLGLNNMNRRKMRTWLTCATLTLLTFVMICFTSVQNTVLSEDVALGKAQYQGVLVKLDQMMPISESEVSALRAKFSEYYDVCFTRLLLGDRDDAAQRMRNPDLQATYDGAGSIAGQYRLEAAIQLSHAWPLRNHLRLLTRPRWFTQEEGEDGSGVPVAMIPDRMADNLGITPSRVDSGGVRVTVAGIEFEVIGIFTASSLAAVRDLDGRDILPFNIEKMPAAKMVDNQYVANEEDPRIEADRILLTPARSLFKDIANCKERITSVAISMEGTGYRDARRDIEGYLEQTGQRLYYGLDGMAYRGRRARGTSFAGLLDLLIPLLIAGMTVLNTMKGSVYERRDEIFVYNAVGIAPRHVFFMFIAEAFVYAVVGAVAGYVISQGTGSLLTVLGLTGGLNMTFASIATIYASLTIAAAVFASTYYPARSAMEIAAPAEESGWTLPEPDADELEFDLPFNFSPHGRIAVLAFFNRYLCDNGEGSAGRFFAGVPRLGLSAEAEGSEAGGYVPQIVTQVWLKPFDLAVCQRMTIMMPPDPETGQFKARILLQRLSGTRESWMRLNHGFVALVRRHFLHWRAVSEQERDEMYAEARDLLRAAYNIGSDGTRTG